MEVFRKPERKRFYVPKEPFNSGEFDDRYKKESKLVYITHQIIYLSCFAPGYWENDFVPLWSVALNNIVGDNYKKYINYLKDRNIIVKGENGSKAKGKSTTYAIHPQYRDDYKVYYCEDEALLGRLSDYIEEHRNSYLFWQTEPYKHLRKSIEKTEIDALNAAKWISGNDSLTKRQKWYNAEAVKSIHKDSCVLGVNSTNGRVETPVTNLKKELRSFLRLDGSGALVESDITNSQPFFLALLQARSLQAGRKVNPSPNNPAYVPHPHPFIRDAQNGVVYERLGDELDISREEAKTRMFEILFSHPNDYTERKKDFERLYPDAYDFVVSYKQQNGYNELAIKLQKLEAEMMEKTCLRLQEEDILVLTVFDSIIVKEEHADEAHDIFASQFEDLEPQIQMERL